jgi:hypothetical protein
VEETKQIYLVRPVLMILVQPIFRQYFLFKSLMQLMSLIVKVARVVRYFMEPKVELESVKGLVAFKSIKVDFIVEDLPSNFAETKITSPGYFPHHNS